MFMTLHRHIMEQAVGRIGTNLAQRAKAVGQ